MRPAVPLGLFVALIAPFFLNDIGFMLAGSAPQWLAVDYVSKAIAVAAVILVPTLRRAVASGSRWPANGWFTAAGIALVTAACVAGIASLDWLGWDEAIALQTFYPIAQSWLLVFDLAIGLTLTAIAEEIVFRRLFIDTFATRLAPLGLYVVSATLFAAIHWSNGAGTIAGAFLAGLLLMWLTRRTGSVLPAVAAHYCINLILFWP